MQSLERSIAFYRDVLGLELVFQWNPQAPYISELVGYPDVDLHGAILRVPGTDVCLELLEYRNIRAGRWTCATAMSATAISPSTSTIC